MTHLNLLQCFGCDIQGFKGFQWVYLAMGPWWRTRTWGGNGHPFSVNPVLPYATSFQLDLNQDCFRPITNVLYFTILKPLLSLFWLCVLAHHPAKTLVHPWSQMLSANCHSRAHNEHPGSLLYYPATLLTFPTPHPRRNFISSMNLGAGLFYKCSEGQEHHYPYTDTHNHLYCRWL